MTEVIDHGIDTNTDTQSIADTICQHLNCRNIGAWLEDLALKLDVPIAAIIPTSPVLRHEFFLPECGLRLVLNHPHAGYVEEGDIDRWIINEAQFIVSDQNHSDDAVLLPFDLDPDNDTPETVQTKLDGDTAGLSVRSIAQGDRRQSYLLDDAVVVEIIWRPELRGIDRV
ncbi:hypothetical protein AAKU64_004631, partial [Undibacterium sp. GrIS 1.8]|uniref:hypothetical protein n=1 Tax=Undibacterium sp. GrIS 1.8 TaxID=3143934 RepID=UPI0033961083